MVVIAVAEADAAAEAAGQQEEQEEQGKQQEGAESPPPPPPLPPQTAMPVLQEVDALSEKLAGEEREGFRGAIAELEQVIETPRATRSRTKRL